MGSEHEIYSAFDPEIHKYIYIHFSSAQASDLRGSSHKQHLHSVAAGQKEKSSEKVRELYGESQREREMEGAESSINH